MSFRVVWPVFGGVEPALYGGEYSGYGSFTDLVRYLNFVAFCKEPGEWIAGHGGVHGGGRKIR
ncbi:hypothetical protein [Hymenobacter metallicola]|uniref:Uncharacterized protein n=1 Tax=Hymenobacter metallicola TaxID=2563114 RepID=A0A4Z0QJG9_9BACT|nr:hypothetical protein [Hymenobacter metallicola]TGE29845.1 hypothetical protein E5K02_10400 [Hymenobacter metallicola]